MIFYETAIFTKQITSLLDDTSYTELQKTLVLDPEAGALIQRFGGLRKIRWKLAGKGKSGGIRAIYYLVDGDEIYFLFAYPKTKQENLTPEQLKTLRELVKQNLEK